MLQQSFQNVLFIVLSEPQLNENRNLQIARAREQYNSLLLPRKIGQPKKRWSFSMLVNMQ